jgi:hypothetical protein
MALDLADPAQGVLNDDPLAERGAPRGVALRGRERLQQGLLRMQGHGAGSRGGAGGTLRARLADGRPEVRGRGAGRDRRHLACGTGHTAADEIDREGMLGKAIAVGTTQALARIVTPCACSGPMRGLAR